MHTYVCAGIPDRSSCLQVHAAILASLYFVLHAVRNHVRVSHTQMPEAYQAYEDSDLVYFITKTGEEIALSSFRGGCVAKDKVDRWSLQTVGHLKPHWHSPTLCLATRPPLINDKAVFS